MERKISVGDVISRVFTIYRDHFGVLFLLALAIFVAAAILEALLWKAGGIVTAFLAYIILLFALFIYQGTVVRLVESVQAGDGRAHSAGELLGSVGPVLLPLIGAGILAGIGIAVGFVLLIVPGLFLLTIWAVIAPAIVVERVGVFDSFGRSYELVRGNGWEVFGTVLVFALIAFGVSAILQSIGIGIGDFAGVLVAGLIANVLTAPLSGLVASVLFFDLRGIKEGAPAPAPAGGAPPPP